MTNSTTPQATTHTTDHSSAFDVELAQLTRNNFIEARHRGRLILLGPDGKLTHDLDPIDHGPKDACGVFGVWAPGEDVAKLTYYGLYALQHRGQESAGIATSNGKRIHVYKDMGLVSQVFDEATLSSMPGDHAIGHARYSTTGASHWANAQPTLGTTPHGTLCLAHNGNLTNSETSTSV